MPGPKVKETTEVITVTLESGGVGFGFVPVPVGTETGVIPAEEVSTGFLAGGSTIVLVGVGQPVLRGTLTLETWRLKWRYLWRPWEEASEKAARATVRAMVVLEKKCMVAEWKNRESQVGDIDRSRA